jgi:hypothetical protein
VVEVLGRLRTATGHQLPMTDLFRFPTVAALASHLSGDNGSAPALKASQDRAAARRGALQRRQQRMTRPTTGGDQENSE